MFVRLFVCQPWGCISRRPFTDLRSAAALPLYAHAVHRIVCWVFLAMRLDLRNIEAWELPPMALGSSPVACVRRRPMQAPLVAPIPSLDYRLAILVDGWVSQVLKVVHHTMRLASDLRGEQTEGFLHRKVFGYDCRLREIALDRAVGSIHCMTFGVGGDHAPPRSA